MLLDSLKKRAHMEMKRTGIFWAFYEYKNLTRPIYILDYESKYYDGYMVEFKMLDGKDYGNILYGWGTTPEAALQQALMKVCLYYKNKRTKPKPKPCEEFEW